jgi:hypothetical protein
MPIGEIRGQLNHAEFDIAALLLDDHGARPLCGHIIPCEWRRTVAVDVSATDDEEAGWRGAALS